MQIKQVQNGIASLFQVTKSVSTSMDKTKGTAFDDLLQTSKLSNQAENSSQETKDTSAKQVDTSTKNEKAESTDAVVGTEKECLEGKDIKETEESVDVELETCDKELAEKVAGLFVQVTEVIQDMLGISEEELQSFMEQMGITEVDLLNPSVLQNLVLLVKDQEPIDLLTNEQLAIDVQNLVKQVETLVEDTGITAEEIVTVMKQPEFEKFVAEVKELLKAPEELLEQSTLNMDVKQPLEKQENENIVTEVVEVVEEQEVLEENEVVKEQEVVEGQEVVEEIEVVKEVKVVEEDEEVVEIKETTIKFQKTVESETKTFENNHQDSKESFTDERSFADQFLQNLQQAVDEVSEVSGKTEIASQIREIADQILEKIKITVTPEITSFDMVLTPEELGRVNLTITEQDGIMKASFVTENELAKEAIESNLVQFKEMLTEQGLKVDSIEVTVGNFEFNKNGQAESGQEEQKRGKRRFQTEDTVTTGRTEEDQLAQHFMEGGESTVNYMA